MNTLLDKLKSLETDINVSIIGAGAMGKGLIYQCHITPGVRPVAIADLKIEKCIETAEMIGVKYKIVKTLDALHDAIDSGVLAVTDNGNLLAENEKHDVLVESSNAIQAGAKFVLTALERRKHVVLMNAEIDLVYGPYFMEVAAANGVTCSSIDGDQYGVMKRVIDDFELWGFKLVMAGNIKGFLDRYSNPVKIIPEADKRNLDYKMCTSYTDGTKMNIEQAIIANAFGMKTKVTGMYGPQAKHVDEVQSLFDFEKLWDHETPFVDYILGANPGGGIFCVGYSNHPYQKDMMSYYKMGNGPFYTFYRPYHLCHVEAIASIVEPVLYNKVLLQPTKGFQTDVFTYAKKDLKAGETLDGLGGHTCYGLIENTDPVNSARRLPILLAEDVKLKRDVSKDEKIDFSDIVYNADDFQFETYENALLASKKLNS